MYTRQFSLGVPRNIMALWGGLSSSTELEQQIICSCSLGFLTSASCVEMGCVVRRVCQH